MPADRIASILFAILFGGCCLAFVVMAIADKLTARKPLDPPTVPRPSWETETDPDIRLYLFQLTEHYSSRPRGAPPPSPEVYERAKAAEYARVRDGWMPPL